MSSMEDENPRKRARLDPAAELDGVSNGDARERKPDEEFWFEDGTIILIAGNIEFRVYKGFLANRSLVFRDMFSFPQPAITSPSSSTCPVVHLPDSAEDVRELLRILMPGAESTQ